MARMPICIVNSNGYVPNERGAYAKNIPIAACIGLCTQIHPKGQAPVPREGAHHVNLAFKMGAAPKRDECFEKVSVLPRREQRPRRERDHFRSVIE